MLVVINDSLALRILQLRTALFGYLRNRDVPDMMEANVVVVVVVVVEVVIIIIIIIIIIM